MTTINKPKITEEKFDENSTFYQISCDTCGKKFTAINEKGVLNQWAQHQAVHQ